MQPYRLEMGLKWAIASKTPNLYTFWGDRIQQRIEADANGLIINLASKEYSKAAIAKPTQGGSSPPPSKNWLARNTKPKWPMRRKPGAPWRGTSSKTNGRTRKT